MELLLPQNNFIINWLCCFDDFIQGEIHMKYINAKGFLPDVLIEELQSYIQGGYIYIPSSQQKQWGEVSGYRLELSRRNHQITEEYHQGLSVEALAGKYCLSVYTIRKIIYKKS